MENWLVNEDCHGFQLVGWNCCCDNDLRILIVNTQLIYNNTNNKNIFYHYIFHKTYTHTILISSKHVFNQACYILPKLVIDSKGNKSSNSDYCSKPNGQTTYHRVVHTISQNHNVSTVKSP